MTNLPDVRVFSVCKHTQEILAMVICIIMNITCRQTRVIAPNILQFARNCTGI